MSTLGCARCDAHGMLCMLHCESVPHVMLLKVLPAELNMCCCGLAWWLEHTVLHGQEGTVQTL